MKTFYDVLGVTLDATQEEIEEACWKQVRNLGQQLEGAGGESRSGAFREFIAAYNILSNEADRAMYNKEIGAGQIEGAPVVVYSDDTGPTGEYEVPMGIRQREQRHFDIDEDTRLSVLRTGGGTLTFVTTTSDQVVIKGNPPPFAEIREGELVIAASDFNAELSLPDHIGYDLLVRSHEGRIAGVIIREGTIESHGTEIDIEVGGGLDLDLSRSKDIKPVVSGMELVDSGLYVAPRQSSAGRTLIVKAVGGSITVRYSRFDFS
ncbi:MAG: J domain-containing protein [Deltaproteobacteria bacterium]|nr:J domain-containing protein [Deltaproteobacteria bacterium]